MTSTIDTLGKASRHHMILRVECSCGNRRDFKTIDLVMRFGGGRDPYDLKFRCRNCRPPAKLTLLEAPKPPAVSTIAEHIAGRDRLWISCHGRHCYHRVELDLAVLADRLGPEHSTMHNDLVPLFRCSKCGSKDLGLTHIPDTTPRAR